MRRVTVQPWQRVVRVHRGRFAGELGPGRHWLRWGERVHRLDTRRQAMVLISQDVPTADLVLHWRIVDASAFLGSALDPAGELHLATQAALRTSVVTRSHDELDTGRAAIGAEIRSAVAAEAEHLGIEIVDAVLRDVVLPAELRRAALAELVAAREGRAALERVKAETAALRSMLNAAKLAEQNPALLQLRTLQVAAEPGATVILERPR